MSSKIDNRRRHPRIPMIVDVKISHPSIGESLLKTRNVSDGGLFIVVEPRDMPAVGTIVKGQVQGMGSDSPTLDMEIVRTETQGLGLQFVSVE